MNKKEQKNTERNNWVIMLPARALECRARNKPKLKPNWNWNWKLKRIETETETETETKANCRASLRFASLASWLRLANCERMCGKVFWEINSNAKARAKAMLMKLHEAPVCAKAIACYWNRSKLIYHQWNNIWVAARRQMMIMPKMEHKNATKLCQRSVSNSVIQSKKTKKKKNERGKKKQSQSEIVIEIKLRLVSIAEP